MSSEPDSAAHVLFADPAPLTITQLQTVQDQVSVVWLQGGYEQRIRPGWSATASLQWLSFSPGSGTDGTGYSISFQEVLAGGRWYPLRDFSGLYLQSSLAWERIRFSDVDDASVLDKTMYRLGGAQHLGYSAKWEHFVFDLNLGARLMSSPDTRTLEHWKGSGTVTPTDLRSRYLLTKYFLYPLTPDLNLSMGWRF